jgi:predicted nucleic acid-binding protein
VLENRFLTTFNIVISTQVINELANVLFKKHQQSEAEIRGRIEQILLQVDVIALTEELTLQALEIKSRYQLSWYDSLIVAAALSADCQFLCTEDLQDGLMIENRLQVINPFNI